MIDPELEEARKRWEDHFDPDARVKREEREAKLKEMEQEIAMINKKIAESWSSLHAPAEKDAPKKKNWFQKFIEWQWK